MLAGHLFTYPPAGVGAPPPPPTAAGAPIGTSFSGHLISSSFRIQCFLLLRVFTFSTSVSLASLFKNFRMNRGSQSSEAMPRSLQQRISALDLQPSVAVGMPSASK